MRFLVNENISGTIIRELRLNGHDALSAKESMRGDGDAIILARAQAEQRLVVTQDKDFGELSYRYGLPSACGVVLLRLTGDNPDADNQRALDALRQANEFIGHFVVVQPGRIRIRPLPQKKR